MTDLVTGAAVEVALSVRVPRERLWELVTAVDRIGERSPEATGGSRHDGDGPTPGARFAGRSRFTGGLESTVTCVVVNAREDTREDTREGVREGAAR